MLDISPARYSNFLQWASKGKLKPYPEFGTKYPNLQQAWDKAINGKKFAIDGKVYAYPAFTDSARFNYLYPPWGRVYRIDWAEKVGLRTPDDVYTFDQWNDLVREVVRQDPGGNGPGNTIGQIIYEWLVPGGFGTGSLSPNLTKYVKVNGKWVWGPQLPESFETVKLMKQLYDEGLIWKDQIIVKNDDLRNKMLADQAFSASLSSNPESLDKLGAAYKKAHPDADPTKMYGIAFIKAADGKFLVKQTSDHWTETAMSPRLTDEETERWCEILDYMVSEEGYYMRNFGIPGEDWEMNNGGVVLKWAKNEQGVSQGPTGLVWSNSWPWAGRGGNSDILMMDSPIYSDWARGLVKNSYKKLENKEDLNIIPFDVEQNYFTGPFYTQTGTLESEIIEQCMKMLVSDNLEKDWYDWLKLMEPRVQPVLDEMNANLK
jgi:putative aldouronate transport system substrate-binding protein